MSSGAVPIAVTELIKTGKSICDISKTANANKKPLAGSNFYSEKFHKTIISLTKQIQELQPYLDLFPDDDPEFQEFQRSVKTLKSPSEKPASKNSALKQIEHFCEIQLIPRIAQIGKLTLPITQEVLPLAVVDKPKASYYKTLVIQMNGCYENGWYDGCAVLMRKVIESLIIEIYISANRASDIKNVSSNEFFMLDGLINYFLADKAWHLGRETKKGLPEVKSLGDRSAHTRHYLATKQDVDKVRQNFRVAAAELLALAGYA